MPKRRWFILTSYVLIIALAFLAFFFIFFSPMTEDQIINTGKEPSIFLGTDYKYREFPYSNLTFNSFLFNYLKGECKDDSIEQIHILPCGDRLLVKFPSHNNWVEIPARAPRDSLKIKEDSQWINTLVSITNSVEERAGLLLIISEDGSRSVYITTYQKTHLPFIEWIIFPVLMVSLVGLLVLAYRFRLPKSRNER